MGKIIKLLYAISIAFLLLITSSSLQANGFGVSGNFSNYHYKLVPGETISTPDVFVIFFNNYDVDITVEILPTVEARDGSRTSIADQLDFIIDETIVEIPANSNLRVPIGITLSETAPAGEYTLGLGAEIIPDNIDGITITGSAELQTRLTIFGEAGDISIRSFDQFARPLQTSLVLYRQDENGISPVRASENGIIEDRLVPGDYLVISTFKGYEVARQSFELLDRETKIVDLISQTVFVDDKTVTPRLLVSTELLSSVRINYFITNIHTTVEDVRLYLKVFLDGELIDESEEATIPFLPEATVEGNFSYTPPEGWRSGNYEFVMDVYRLPSDDEASDFLGSGPLRELFVPQQYIDGLDPEPEPEPEPEPIDDPEPEPEPEPEPIDDLEPEPEPEPEESSNALWIVLVGLVSVLSLFLIWLLFIRCIAMNALQYAHKRFEASDPEMDINNRIQYLKQINSEMNANTDFQDQKKGTKAYYDAVDTFIQVQLSEPIDSLGEREKEVPCESWFKLTLRNRDINEKLN